LISQVERLQSISEKS